MAVRTGGGVKTIQIQVDGTTTTTYTASCDYTHPQPCPTATETQTLTLDTTTLSDGAHTLSVKALDAAGNESTISSEQIDVENKPPPPPRGLTVTPTAPGSQTFTVNWINPTGLSSPITSATYQLCPSGSTEGCTSAATAPATGPITIIIPGYGRWLLSLWLTNAAGNSNPTNAATTEVTAAPAQQTEPPSPVETPMPAGIGPTPPGPLPTTAKPAPAPAPVLRVTAYLHHGHVVVHARDPKGGILRLTLTTRLHGKVITLARKTRRLHNGQAVVIFGAPRKTSLRYALRVTASLGGSVSVHSLVERLEPEHLYPKEVEIRRDSAYGDRGGCS